MVEEYKESGIEPHLLLAPSCFTKMKTLMMHSVHERERERGNFYLFLNVMKNLPK
jgi:hypothetical protein